MMISGIFLAYYSSIGSGGAIGDILFKFEQAGVFSYLLPFLLIFALVFGILSSLNLFEGKDKTGGKGINAVIALAIGLMALQFNFVSVFFSEIFPRMGIALSIVLVFLVLLGLFATKNGKLSKGFKGFMFLVVLVTIAFVIIDSFNAYGWYTGYGVGYFLQYNLGTIIGVLIFFGAIIAIIFGASGKSDKDKGIKILTGDY